jgi:alpha-D-xyloside xylohydrolase
MKWRDVNADQAQVLSDVSEFKALGIPIGTIWIDNPWERQPPGITARSNSTSCRGSLTFDPTFFPNPQQMIDTIHAEGVKFGLWVSPLGETSASGASCAGTGSDVWADNGWLIPGTDYIDLSNPAARNYYIARLTELFKMGVNMTKEDRGEEFRLQTTQLAGGSGADLSLEYSKLYQSAVTAALRAANGDDFETLVRAGSPGTAAVTHGMWGSDSYETFAGLRAEVRYGTSEPLGGGDFAWGSDTGGIDPQPPATPTDSPTPALFDRWAQFSAISPVFEVGGAGLNATPWEYPASTVDNFRASVILHYELFPYMYGLAEHAARTGVPILRSLGYQYPDDPSAWEQDQEVMVGPDLLAAPVSADRAQADGAAGQPTPVSVYLPPGRWVDLFSGQVLDGGRTVVDDAALNEFPLYMRAGTAIGFNARTPNVWGVGGWTTDEQTRPGLAGWMYAPGSRASAGSISAGAGRLAASTAGGDVRLVLHGAPAHVQILVLTQHAPSTVAVDGKPLRRFSVLASLQQAGQGWMPSSQPFGGVIVKLSGGHGDATVNLRAGR